MRLLLDEMHAPVVAETLRADGHDVVAVAETAELRGLADEDVLIHATAEGRAVVTENVVDFAALATRWATEGRAHGGLVFTNPRRCNRATRAYPGNLIESLRVLLRDPPELAASGIWWL